MGLSERIVGFLTAPFVGPTHDNNGPVQSSVGYSDKYDDVQSKTIFPNASGLQMAPLQMMEQPGDFISNRGYGTHNLIPGRAISAQTRMKNKQYELPAYGWTQNPEGPAYLVRVPGLPNQVLNLQTMRGLAIQPEYLQPITNLQIQNNATWFNRFRASIFGQAQNQIAQSQSTMFPSIFGDTGE